MRWLSYHIYIHGWTLKDGKYIVRFSERNWNILLTFKLQSTLAPRTTPYDRNPAISDKSQPSGEKRFKKWLKQVWLSETVKCISCSVLISGSYWTKKERRKVITPMNVNVSAKYIIMYSNNSDGVIESITSVVKIFIYSSVTWRTITQQPMRNISNGWNKEPGEKAEVIFIVWQYRWIDGEFWKKKIDKEIEARSDNKCWWWHFQWTKTQQNPNKDAEEYSLPLSCTQPSEQPSFEDFSMWKILSVSLE